MESKTEKARAKREKDFKEYQEIISNKFSIVYKAVNVLHPFIYVCGIEWADKINFIKESEFKKLAELTNNLEELNKKVNVMNNQLSDLLMDLSKREK